MGGLRGRHDTESEQGDSFNACLLFPAIVLSQPRAEHIPQASPPLEFTVQWAGLLIKHMWTCRGMGRDGVLRTASLCIRKTWSARTHVHAQE